MPSHKYSLITLLLSLMLAAFAQNLSQVQNLFTSPPNHPARAVAFSPDGSLLAVALWDGGSIKILEADSGREVASLVGHTSYVNSVAFSPDGSFLASGSWNSTVKIWRTADFSLVHSLEEHTGTVRSVAFSPAGDFLASGSLDNTVKIWRTADFSLVASLEEHTHNVLSVAFSPAGDFLASGSRDKTIKIWRTADFSLVDSLEEHTLPVYSVAFSPAGDFLASGSLDNTVKIWHVSDSYSLHKTIAGINSDGYYVGSVAFHPAGTSLAIANKRDGHAEGVVSLWGTASRQAVFCPSGCGAVQYVDVTIRSTAGASVTVDEQALAESSAGVFTGRFGVGKYNVSISKAGYQSRNERVDVAANRGNAFEFMLLPSLEHRVALVIGNNDYLLRPLVNPVNDARAMAQELRYLGFEVIERVNLDKDAMNDALIAFERALQARDNAVGLIYFAGHGVEVNGTNYLIPTNATPTDSTELKYHAVSLDTMLAALHNNNVRFSIVILDACRNDPFARSFSGGRGGLAEVDSRDFRPAGPGRGARGLYLAFSTAPGEVADDGDGSHSPYTSSLLQQLRTSNNVEIVQLFRTVREDVYQKTNNKQLPWDNTNMIGSFYFSQP